MTMMRTRPDAGPEPITAAAPEISVVVCTYRRADKLPSCLDALAASDDPRPGRGDRRR